MNKKDLKIFDLRAKEAKKQLGRMTTYCIMYEDIGSVKLEADNRMICSECRFKLC